MYKACIFDLDGTILNTLYSIADFGNEALTKCGYATIPTEKYKTLVGNGAAVLIERMLSTAKPEGHTKEENKKLRRIYDNLYESNPCKGLVDYDGIKKLFSDLKNIGNKICVLSNKPDNCVRAILENHFSQNTFDYYRGQTDDIPKKPSPDGALMISKIININPEDILYIGDTDTDMQTGKNSGMDTCGVLWGFRNEKELKDNNAKFIAHTPDDIFNIVKLSIKM